MTTTIQSKIKSWITSGVKTGMESNGDTLKDTPSGSISIAFAEELSKCGDDTVLECFNCGTCSAICPLVGESFPRKMIRYVQIGAKDRILDNAEELWRCLHCGLCTRTCPREADPGEVILALKRFVLSGWRRS
ncbi:conserved hypothetical protein [Desulfamplus magnetovallimortis]|uniref:4Fe-4S ferredoxin-type domain-containing protein n=1 Tax=Desulfamplus magnetovallimortis TaxID=1246637 RepID=A0A1W1H6F6_9BACT|nr:4Fe-4S dicluster domain-containing protein [Desulfamplus magnetovallimortis]SLM28049.1 conserved hypothetical protein [Desulfamplus magnetovallimortis]